MQQKSETIRYKPSIGWSYAIFSAVVTISLALVIVVAAALWEHEHVLQKLDQAVASGDSPAIAKLIPVLERGAARIDAFQDLSTFSNSRANRAELRAMLYQVGFYRDLQNSEDARSSLHDCTALPSETYPANLQSLLRVLKNLLTQLVRSQSQLKGSADEIATLEANRKKIVAQHALLATDFSEFFSIPPAYKKRGENELLAYGEGMLKDLPILENLDDALPDASSLKEALAKASARVKLVSNDPAKEFNERISALKDTSAMIVKDYNSTLEQIAAVNRADQERRQKIKNLAQKIHTTITISLGNASRANLQIADTLEEGLDEFEDDASEQE